MVTLRYLGHSAFYIKGEGLTALIDPYLNANPKAAAKAEDFTDVNAIFLTHMHGDHLGDTVEIAKRTGAKVFCVGEAAAWLSSKGVKIEGMQIGGRAKFNFGRVKITPALHGTEIIENGAMNYAGLACGFVIEVEGKKIYHAGDTGLTMEMQLLEAEKIDAACLPIGGYFTMDIEDAVRAVSFIKPANVIPMHYDTFPKIKVDPKEFAEGVKAEGTDTKVQILAAGEAIEL